jgi:hypothetical protein
MNGVQFGPGEVGRAFIFDGNSQYVQIPHTESLVPKDSFSIEAWIRPTAVGDQAILSKWSDTQRAYVLAVTTGNGLRFAISDEKLQGDSEFHHFETTNGVVPLNQWSHVAAVYDQPSGKRSIFLNGKLVAERVDPPITVIDAPNNAAIGAREAGPSLPTEMFIGSIDEVSLYDRALSASEIAAIYKAGTAGKCETMTPVLLQNATATFSQTDGNFTVVHAFDGITDDNSGWAIAPQIGNQTAVVETKENIGIAGGTVFTFTFIFNHHSVPGTVSHTLGRFRLLATADSRDAFADGLPIGGDVTANWSVLQPLTARAQSGATLTVLPDGSILASGTLVEKDVYTVTALAPISGITGFRLEALTDPSLPLGGPGREPSNGNFVV